MAKEHWPCEYEILCVDVDKHSHILFPNSFCNWSVPNTTIMQNVQVYSTDLRCTESVFSWEIFHKFITTTTAAAAATDAATTTTTTNNNNNN